MSDALWIPTTGMTFYVLGWALAWAVRGSCALEADYWRREAADRRGFAARLRTREQIAETTESEGSATWWRAERQRAEGSAAELEERAEQLLRRPLRYGLARALGRARDGASDPGRLRHRGAPRRGGPGRSVRSRPRRSSPNTRTRRCPASCRSRPTCSATTRRASRAWARTRASCA